MASNAHDRQPAQDPATPCATPCATARRLENRVALVFGAGSIGPGWGNGKAAAVQYAREGARIVAIDIDPAAAEETRGIIAGEGGEAIALACDVTRRDQIDGVVSTAREHFGTIDILHNNVGLPAMGKLAEITEDQWQLAMDVNLKSVLLCCQATVPTMLERGRGAIVNISSLAAIRYTGYPYPAYYASKAAVNHLTVSIAMEFADRGIRANAIMPGVMDTPHIYRNIVGAARIEGSDDRGPTQALADRPDGHGLGRREGRRLPGLGRCGVHHRSVSGGRRGSELPSRLRRSHGQRCSVFGQDDRCALRAGRHGRESRIESPAPGRRITGNGPPA